MAFIILTDKRADKLTDNTPPLPVPKSLHLPELTKEKSEREGVVKK
jgi:hypothetical protein